MSATAVAEVQRLTPQPFSLGTETPKRLAELGLRARPRLNASQMLQVLVTHAYDAIVLGTQPKLFPFAQRVRQLAAQQQHPAKEVRTSFKLDVAPGGHMDAIRRLRETLQLPRRDLVVEYVTQAAWELPPDGDGGDGEREDPLDRTRKMARFHNVETSGSRHLTSLPHPDQARFFFDEEVSTKS